MLCDLSSNYILQIETVICNTKQSFSGYIVEDTKHDHMNELSEED